MNHAKLIQSHYALQKILWIILLKKKFCYKLLRWFIVNTKYSSIIYFIIFLPILDKRWPLLLNISLFTSYILILNKHKSLTSKNNHHFNRFFNVQNVKYIDMLDPAIMKMTETSLCYLLQSIQYNKMNTTSPGTLNISAIVTYSN